MKISAVCYQLFLKTKSSRATNFPERRKASCRCREYILNAGKLPSLEPHTFLNARKLPAVSGKLSCNNNQTRCRSVFRRKRNNCP